MDGTEDSSYLTLLNDGTHNYLLQTTEEALGVQDPSLNVEPMFTEIEDATGAWSVGLPILMNGNLIPEADQELPVPMDLGEQDNNVEMGIDLPASLPELYDDSLENGAVVTIPEGTSEVTQMQYPIEIPGKGFITADGLFIANDLLLELKLGGEDLSLSEENTKNVEEPLDVVPEQESILINPKTLVPHNGNIINGHEVCYENLETSQSLNGYENMQSSEPLNGYEHLKSAEQLNGYETSESLNGYNKNNELPEDCLENGQIFDVQNLNASGDIIQLLNTDGTVINITKEQLLNYDGLQDQPEESPETNGESGTLDENTDDFFEVIMAHKCKQCSFLCETRDDVMKHWNNEHVLLQPQIQEETSPVVTQDNNLIEPKTVVEPNMNGEVKIMKSILKNKVEKTISEKEKDHQTVFLCSECNLGFGGTDKLRSHMMMMHGLVKKLCENIVPTNTKETKNPAVKTKPTVALIHKQAKAAKKIKCSVKGCDLRFALQEMRIRHEQCHIEGQKKQFKCFECDNKFSLWRVCSMHMWKCHKVDLGLFTCPMCSVFKSTTAAGLVNHMATHEEEKPYVCSDCGKNFKLHSHLRNHQVLHKKVNHLKVPEWAVQQQCDICKKFFANSKSLKKHVQSVHDKFKPFICNICGHKTARKSMLDLHLRQHTGEKPHKCPICDYKTGDHNSLRRHVMRHSGDTKYSCPHCNYTSIQSTSYKNHIASKHPGLGGSYFCTLCSYHTVNENTYLCHLADHENGLIKENCDNDAAALYKTLTSSLMEDSDTHYNKQISKDTEDDETQNYLLLLDHSNDAVDTGGITIPAGFELQVPL